jgi:hypothetical protein
VGVFNTPVSPIDRSSRQKIKKETLELNDTIEKMNQTDIYRDYNLQQDNLHSSQQPMELSPK